ncbi:Aurovertin biosynthesis cluster transcription factor aurF [Metarhizium anisopliae]
MYSNLSPGRNGCTPNTTRGTIKEAPNGAAVDPVRQKILLAARTCIRADYLHFLQTNLARWTKEGLWQKESPQAAGASVRDYEKLRNAYSCVCRLDKRMRDDPIRTRIALVLLHLEYENTCLKWKTGRRNPSVVETRLGRGTTSSMIDQILENIHPEWRVADARLRAELRADFHNRKRYGKRWWILTNALGPGLLILCSSKIAAIIKNTAVTITMLRGIADAIRSSEPASVGILKLVTPVADSLFSNHGYASHDTEQLLRELGTFQLPVLEDEDGHVA